MSHVIKLNGYSCEELERFVDEQKALDSGTWTYTPYIQTVRIADVYITYTYKREMIIAQGRVDVVRAFTTQFVETTRRMREIEKRREKPKRAEPSTGMEAESSARLDQDKSKNEKQKMGTEEYIEAQSSDEYNEEYHDSDVYEWRLNNETNIGRWLGEEDEEGKTIADEEQKERTNGISEWSRW